MERQRVRVLLIEDDPDYTMLMNMYVNEACGDSLLYLLESAVSLQAALDLLARKEFDIVLLDLMLPDSEGLDTLIKVRAKAADLPAVVLTNLEKEDLGLQAIAHGAQDFLLKSKVDANRLRHSIGFALARNRVFRQMEKLIEAAPDGMVIVDRERMVRHANAAALTLFGKTREQMVGRMFEHPTTPGQPTLITLRPEAGAEVAAEMRVAEIDWRGGPAWLASIRDVSELKKLEQARAEVRERLRMDQMKDQLLGTVAHELRTPLSIIKAVIGTLRDGLAGALNAEQSSLVGSADRSIGRLTRLLNNFLDLTRLESRSSRVSRQPADLLALVRESVEGARMANRGRRTAFAFELPARLPEVSVDSDMIAQVLGNLLDNAARYARERVVVSASEGAGTVEVSVIDDGPGIPAGKVEDLFNKFVQLDRPHGRSGYKGTGLGLAISREIVQIHGGRIWAENEPGRGARFRFTLPTAAVPAGALQEGPHAGASS